MSSNACLNCKDRHEKCHSTCEKYLKFKKELEELHEAKRKQYDLEDYYYNSRYKNNKKKRR